MYWGVGFSLGRPDQGVVGYIGFSGGYYSFDSDSVCLSLGFETLEFPLVWCLGFKGVLDNLLLRGRVS